MKGNINVMPGAKGIKQAYELVLASKKADIVCLSQDFEAVVGDYFDTYLAPKMYGKLRTRELLPDTADNRDYAKTKDAGLNEVRFTKMQTTNTDFIVTESLVILISFDTEVASATVISDPELVKFMGNMFEEIYRQAGE